MRRLFGILCSASLMAALSAGCSGSETTPGEAIHPGTTHSETATQSATAPPTQPTGSPAQGPPTLFPLTITRTGGIAGFQDKLVVNGSGLVSISDRGQEPRRCQLAGPALERLTKAASRVPWAKIRPASREPSFPDDMVTTVQSRAGGPVAVEDPRVAGGRQELITLLNDLSRAPGSGDCTPV